MVNESLYFSHILIASYVSFSLKCITGIQDYWVKEMWNTKAATVTNISI